MWHTVALQTDGLVGGGGGFTFPSRCLPAIQSGLLIFLFWGAAAMRNRWKWHWLGKKVRVRFIKLSNKCICQIAHKHSFRVAFFLFHIVQFNCFFLFFSSFLSLSLAAKRNLSTRIKAGHAFHEFSPVHVTYNYWFSLKTTKCWSAIINDDRL